MKKMLSTLLLAGAVITSTLTPVLATPTYKVYNPKANKAYMAILGTIGVGNNKYLFGFFLKNQPLCVIEPGKSDYKNGLVVGQCVEIGAFERFTSGEKVDFGKYEYSWRENTADTFLDEKKSLEKERAMNGWYILGK